MNKTDVQMCRCADENIFFKNRIIINIDINNKQRVGSYYSRKIVKL